MSASAHKAAAFATIADVELHIERMEVLAEWKAELQRRIVRAELCCGFGVLTDRHLEDEVHAFNTVCLALAASLRRAS
jgi:hypothetical protein